MIGRRTFVLRSLVAGLCVAAAVAIVGILTGSWDDTSWKIVGTSLGFSVFTATASAGSGPRIPRSLAVLTVGASIAAYALLLAALWTSGSDNETLWRGFGIAGLLALWSAHASLLVRSRRSDDSDAVRWLTAIAIATLGVDTTIAVLALVEVVDEIDGGVGRLIGVIVVLAILSTVLVPILRRLAPASRAEIAEIAGRLAAMDLPPEARAEVARLRRLTGPVD